ncbi:MAG: riboflavin synthase [Spirochaetia bacterium]
MFTGLVLEIGTVARVSPGSDKADIEIHAPKLAPEFELGDSVAINGACQTVVATGKRSFTVEALAETLKKTTLGSLRTGARVNLEPAVTAATPLGGHLVQGHVNETARVESVRQDQENIYFTIEVGETAARYCVAEGSICIDGVSLTVAKLHDRLVTINIIPHTWEATVLVDRQAGDLVNIETDIIARYVERFMEARFAGARGTQGSAESIEKQLNGWGY